MVASPTLPGLRLPSSARFNAKAALTVVAAITSASGTPRQRNFDMVVTWSKAGPLMQSAWTSDEMVSGKKPLASIARADPDLDADDDVAIGIGDLDRIDRCHQPQFLAFADHHPRRERVDSGEGDVQIGEDAHFAALDHVLAKSGEIAGPGAAGIDRRGHARAAAEIFGVDAK